jgi:succinate dehydrogenase / fumarate reductase cytochrome b subunit
MTLSILHRATGIAMSVGLVFMAAWLLSAATGPTQYTAFVELMNSLPGQLLLLGWSFSFFFHLMNGVRHLAWDVGFGFEKQQANNSGYFVIFTAVAMTAVFWLVLL